MQLNPDGDLTDADRALLGQLLDTFKSYRRESRLIHPTPLISEAFVDRFGARLQMFHATHSETRALQKKDFEYAFEEAVEYCGERSVQVIDSRTNPDGDVRVSAPGGVLDEDSGVYSLKTEASQNISRDSITISKLMECAWIGPYDTREDYARLLRERAATKLRQAVDIFMLRAFGRLSRNGQIEYHLVHIPVSVFYSVGEVEPSDVSDVSLDGVGSARLQLPVSSETSETYQIFVDGSDEKLTVDNLNVGGATSVLAMWEIFSQSQG